MSEAREWMRHYLVAHSLLAGEVKLSGGGTANFYFDCKRATLQGEFLIPLADWLLDHVIPSLPTPPTLFGGPTLGADFIAAAAVMRAVQRGRQPTTAAIVRKEAKKHGTQSMIENEQPAGAVLVVEDVITTGGSIARACDEFISAGHKIAGIAAIIDREAGGKETLAARYGAPVSALFSKSDFTELAK